MTTTTRKPNGPKKPALTPPLKWHGGKHYLAPEIIKLMPPRCKNPNKPDPSDPGWLHYVEPYFGGGAVLLANDPEGISEVANDLYSELTSFWRVLRCPVQWPRFNQLVEATAFGHEAYEAASAILEQEKHNDSRDEGEYAWAFFVLCRQSLSGRMKGFAGITRNRTRRGMNEQVSALLNCIEGLPAVHERLKRVLILNKPAIEVIKKEDGDRSLFYCDPPYLHETRSATGEYAHEMTVEQHQQLLEALDGIKGKFLLSGYRSGLYDEWAFKNKWNRYDFDLPNNAASGKSKQRKTECVWMNY